MVIIALLLLFITYVRTEKGQNALLPYATCKISEILGTEVTASHISVDPFTQMTLNNTLVLDNLGDTLLSTKRLSLDISLFSFFNRQLAVDKLKLEGGKLLLTNTDGVSNYQHIIDNLGGEEDTSTEAPAPWKLDLETIQLQDFLLIQEGENTILNVDIAQLDGHLENFDASFETLNFSKLSSDGLVVSYSEKNKDVQNGIPAAFPTLPLSIQISDLKLTDSKLSYNRENAELTTDNGRLDPNHLQFYNLHLEARDFRWGQSISGDIVKLTFDEKSNLSVKDLNSAFHLTPNSLGLQNFQLNTPSSKVDLDLEIDFNSFDQLINDITSTKLSSEVRTLQLDKIDLEAFISFGDSKLVNIAALDELDFQGQISAKNERFYIQNSKIRIKDKLAFDGNFLYNARRGTYTGEINALKSTQSFLHNVIPSLEIPSQLKDLGEFNANGNFYGDHKSIQFEKLSMASKNGLQLLASGSIQDFTSIGGPKMDLNISLLETDFNQLLYKENGIPEALFELGKIQYSGSFKGNLYNMDIDGQINSEIGDADLEMEIEFENDYSSAQYEGRFNVQQLDIGKLINDDKFGPTSASGFITGSGISMDDLDIKVDVKATKIYYNSETYKNISVAGTYVESAFEGKVVSKDEKLKLDFEGKANLDGENTIAEFITNLDQLDLTQFGIGDSTLWISGVISGNIKGDNIDNIIGASTIDDFKLGTPYGVYSSNTPIVIYATDKLQGTKEYSIQSEFIEGNIIGNINLSQLPKVLESYFKKYIPIEFGYEGDLAVEDSTFIDQNFIVDLKTKNISPLLKVLTNDALLLKKGSLGGYFASDDANMDLKGSLDSLLYKGYSIGNTDFFFDGRDQFINGNIIISDVSKGNNTIIHEAIITSSLNNKVADFFFELYDQEDSEILSLGGALSQTTEYVFTFNDSLFINKESWLIDPYNSLSYGEEGLYISGLNISKGGQNLSIYTDENVNGPAIELLFNDFILTELSGIIGQPNEVFEGQINGSAMINNIWKNPFVIADIDVQNIAINQNPVGSLTIESVQNSVTQTVENKVKLKGFENDAVLNLDYGIQNKALKGNLNLTKLQMNAIDPLLSDVLKNSGGTVSGNLEISGNLQKPVTLGTLRIDEVETTPVFTNSSFKLSNGDIRISSSSIDIDPFTLYDAYNNEAKLSGRINHSFLSNFSFDLRFKTDKFQFLNTTSNENELFHGNIQVSADISVSGPSDKVLIEGEAKSIDQSNLVISPFSSDLINFENEFIIYADPRKVSLDSLNKSNLSSKDTYPFDLDVKISIDEGSTFDMIMDPITGDKLTCNGNADLNIKIKQTGEMELYGAYIVSQGTYEFSYGVFNRVFDIQKGGRVNFNGNPLEGILDVSAIYIANVTVYDLIKLETTGLTDAQISEAQSKREMNVVLNLSKSILSPEIKMDITNTDTEFSNITDVLENKLNQMRSDPNELNNQVFGLLLFNNFLLANSAESELAQTGTNFAFNSLSSLVTQQLNKLTDGLIKGVELNFDVSSYSSQFANEGDGGLVTELGVGVSKKLFNNRLTVTAGTNINLESSSDNAVFNTIAGDFVLRYKLNERGNYTLTAFRKTSSNRLLDDNASKNGGSFTIRKEFGRVKKVNR